MQKNNNCIVFFNFLGADSGGATSLPCPIDEDLFEDEDLEELEEDLQNLDV
jgi:hypothetical protein